MGRPARTDECGELHLDKYANFALRSRIERLHLPTEQLTNMLLMAGTYVLDPKWERSDSGSSLVVNAVQRSSEQNPHVLADYPNIGSMILHGDGWEDPFAHAAARLMKTAPSEQTTDKFVITSVTG